MFKLFTLILYITESKLFMKSTWIMIVVCIFYFFLFFFCFGFLRHMFVLITAAVSHSYSERFLWGFHTFLQPAFLRLLYHWTISGMFLKIFKIFFSTITAFIFSPIIYSFYYSLIYFFHLNQNFQEIYGFILAYTPKMNSIIISDIIYDKFMHSSKNALYI